jgi:predicted AAA+ superfamily ATPase
MENVIYNELLYRGYKVDIGVVNITETVEEKRLKKNLEIDFVANKGSQRYYIQSAFALPDREKMDQEKRPLTKVNDSFKKIIIVKDQMKLKRDDDGIVTMSLFEFLLDENSLDA